MPRVSVFQQFLSLHSPESIITGICHPRVHGLTTCSHIFLLSYATSSTFHPRTGVIETCCGLTWVNKENISLRLLHSKIFNPQPLNCISANFHFLQVIYHHKYERPLGKSNTPLWEHINRDPKQGYRVHTYIYIYIYIYHYTSLYDSRQNPSVQALFGEYSNHSTDFMRPRNNNSPNDLQTIPRHKSTH